RLGDIARPPSPERSASMNGQLNVTQISDKQPQPSCRFSITATLDGFPITIEGEGRAGDLKLIVDRLKAIGAQPPNLLSAPVIGSEPAKAAGGVPTCSVHPGRKMKASTARPGTFFCTAKDPETGDYCKQKS